MEPRDGAELPEAQHQGPVNSSSIAEWRKSGRHLESTRNLAILTSTTAKTMASRPVHQIFCPIGAMANAQCIRHRRAKHPGSGCLEDWDWWSSCCCWVSVLAPAPHPAPHFSNSHSTNTATNSHQHHPRSSSTSSAATPSPPSAASRSATTRNAPSTASRCTA